MASSSSRRSCVREDLSEERGKVAGDREIT